LNESFVKFNAVFLYPRHLKTLTTSITFWHHKKPESEMQKQGAKCWNIR